MPQDTEQSEIDRLHRELRNTKAEVEKVKGHRAMCLLLLFILGWITFSLWSDKEHYAKNINRYHDAVTSIQKDVDELVAKVDGLKSEADNFSDGITDWRDVIPEVQSMADDASISAADIKEEVDELDEQMTPSEPEPEPNDYPY